MDIQAQKLDLINWLVNLKDEIIINKLYSIKQNNVKDWYIDLSNSQKEAIDKGLTDIKNGNIISHEQVMMVTKNKIQQLKNS